MDTVLTYIFLSAAVLAVLIDCIVFFVNLQRSESRLTRLVALAVALVLAGLLFGTNRLVGYGLVGAGGILAVADLVVRTRQARPKDESRL
jgi:hypothetical protein